MWIQVPAAGSRRLGFKRPAAGKTGTTDNYNDAWFTGFTPSLCVSVWTGYDQKKKLKDKNGRGVTGGRGAVPIWTQFMLRALKGEPERDFRVPEDIRFETVDMTTGCPPGFQFGSQPGLESGSKPGLLPDQDAADNSQQNLERADAKESGKTIRVALKKDQEPCKGY